MKEKDNLYWKRHRNAYEDTSDLDYLYDEKDVKKCIKNSERRIEEVISMEWKKGMYYILKEIEEIFINEFGKKLLK